MESQELTPDPMQAILDRLQKLEDENKALHAELAEQAQASQLPGHLVQGGAITGHPGAARHVILATQPVIDNPHDPLWNGQNIADVGRLVQNSRSRPMRDDG